MVTLKITAHAGSGEHDYLWDYGTRRGTHRRLHSLLDAISAATDTSVPCDGDEYFDGVVQWNIDDDDWATVSDGLRRRITRCVDIRCD